MKMDFEQFRENAGSDPELPASDDEAADGEEPDANPRPKPSKPTMSVDMGPDGTAVSVDAPLNDMDPQEAINLAQEVQGPSMTEEVKEVLLDPTVQDILKEVWYGPDNVDTAPETNQRARAETNTMNPTDELDTTEQTAETDGGTDELRAENVYQITPEGLVAILQQQVGEVAALKPEMTLEKLDVFMEKNEERLVGEARELLEAMDGEE